MSGNEEVCHMESNEWRKCVEQHLTQHKTVTATCLPLQSSFDKCVSDWRATSSGKGVSVRGENPGDPPPQCAAHSCLIGACLRSTSYDFDKCEPPMRFFKHCVKSLYGSEFVE
ncbi:transmembrane protein, putative [Bodo saltans]|uniref:Transmembrane protein, putative n=1 Tax=Bodo saltans TaxID=75058 RepID=A0A0S4JBG6_BODSA|nr:transmembrane protein, putative [Bodo saltans]|eukprot:CUG87363.1 transmembrane protein, putative [Bodo saltans]